MAKVVWMAVHVVVSCGSTVMQDYWLTNRADITRLSERFSRVRQFCSCSKQIKVRHCLMNIETIIAFTCGLLVVWALFKSVSYGGHYENPATSCRLRVLWLFGGAATFEIENAYTGTACTFVVNRAGEGICYI